MKVVRATTGLLLAASLTLAACSDRSTTSTDGAAKAPGTEGGPCNPNKTCNAGLTCSGGHRWSKSFGGANSDTSRGVAIDGAGNAYITGHYNSDVNLGGGVQTVAGGTDVFVASYTSAGGYRWSRSFGGNSSDHGWGIAALGNKAVVTTGYFSTSIQFGSAPISSAGSSDLFVLKLGL